jgi:hypothetical protein
MIYKLLGNEIDINSTANNVGSNKVIRVVNSGTGNTVLLVKYANGTQYASTTVLANSEIVILKEPSDIIVGSNMRATAVAYKA